MEVRRDAYLEKLEDCRGNGLAKIVTGVRRCGKTYPLMNLFHSWLVEQGMDPGRIVDCHGIRAIGEIGDSFKKVIVTGDDMAPRRDESGITTMGLLDFLLDERSLEA